MARSAILLKPNVANILRFNFCVQKFVQHGPITIAIDCNALPLLIFEEKWHKIRTRQIPVLDASAFQCDNFACLHNPQDQIELHLKR